MQLCGPHPDHLTKCAQVIDENISIDFIDVNSGCPIDLIVNKYVVCLLDSLGKRSQPLPTTHQKRCGLGPPRPSAQARGNSTWHGQRPLVPSDGQGIATYVSCVNPVSYPIIFRQIRTGKDEKAPNAHKIIPFLQEYGAAAVTVSSTSQSRICSVLPFSQ